jgi:Transglycosylase-like domain
MLFRQRNLFEKPSKVTIAIAAAGIGVAAAASAVAITLPGGATAGAATATAHLPGAGVASASATPHSAGQLPAHEIEMARRAQQFAAIKAMRIAEARRAARAAARRATRRAAHRAARRAALHQARQAHRTPGTPSAPAQSSGGLSGVWTCISQHESGGNPAANTGNGFYGAFQFTVASWQAVGGPSGLPSSYPLSVQLHYAEVLQARSGWGNWPVTSQMCGA